MLTSDVEFVQCVDTGVLHYKVGDQLRLFSENSKVIIADLNDRVKNQFPTCYTRLCILYDGRPKSAYLKARRFAKCNLSLFDSKSDMSADGSMNVEFVPCPLRGECEDEGIICCPSPLSLLSKRHIDVAKLIDKGMSDADISEFLFIAISTVKTHIKNMLHLTGAKNRTELAHYCREKNIF